MKVQPVAGPTQIQQPSASSSYRNNAVAKLEALNSGAAQQEQPQRQSNHAPQLNQNAITAEDMGAIIPQPNIEDRQLDTSEETHEEPKAEVKQPDPALSRQFAQLARQEKALRAKAQQQEQAIKAREAALNAREDALKAKDQEYSQQYIRKDALLQDPLGVLNDQAGLSYDELSQRALNPIQRDPRVEAMMNKAEQRIAQLEAKLEESAKTQVTQQQAQYQDAIKQISADAKQLVYTDPNFETIKATNSVKDVVELIERTYNEDGKLLSVEDAAQMVEDHLLEQLTKYAQINKVQKRMQENASKSQATSKAPQPAPQSPKQPQPMKTLTNAASSSRTLSAKERAILAFKGELKS